MSFMLSTVELKLAVRLSYCWIPRTQWIKRNQITAFCTTSKFLVGWYPRVWFRRILSALTTSEYVKLDLGPQPNLSWNTDLGVAPGKKLESIFQNSFFSICLLLLFFRLLFYLIWLELLITPSDPQIINPLGHYYKLKSYILWKYNSWWI